MYLVLYDAEIVFCMWPKKLNSVQHHSEFVRPGNTSREHRSPTTPLGQRGSCY